MPPLFGTTDAGLIEGDRSGAAIKDKIPVSSYLWLTIELHEEEYLPRMGYGEVEVLIDHPAKPRYRLAATDPALSR